MVWNEGQLVPCSPDAQKREAHGALSCRVGDGPVLADARIIVTVSNIFNTKGLYLTSSGMEELPYEERDLIVHQKLHQVLSHTAFYSSQRRGKNSSPGRRSGVPRISLLLHLLLHRFPGPIPKQTALF